MPGLSVYKATVGPGASLYSTTCAAGDPTMMRVLFRVLHPSGNARTVEFGLPDKPSLAAVRAIVEPHLDGGVAERAHPEAGRRRQGRRSLHRRGAPVEAA